MYRLAPISVRKIDRNYGKTFWRPYSKSVTWTPKVPKIENKSPRMSYLKHILDIAPISPIYLITLLIGTYIMDMGNINVMSKIC